MATIQDVLAKVTEQKTLVDSIVTFIAGLKGQPGMDSATIDAILAKVDENDAALEAAMGSNVP